MLTAIVRSLVEDDDADVPRTAVAAMHRGATGARRRPGDRRRNQGTRDRRPGVLTPGATATAINRQTAVTRSARSGADGTYRLADLSPGRYRVVVELPGFRSSSIDDVIVVLGRTVDVDVTLQPGDMSEVVEVAGDSRKPIDIRSSTISHNVTGDELDLLPKARSFVAIAATSPSVNLGQIDGGIQVNGASSAENTYTIDGVVTTSLLNGVSRQDTIFEYLQEVQVKTGG